MYRDDEEEVGPNEPRGFLSDTPIGTTGKGGPRANDPY